MQMLLFRLFKNIGSAFFFSCFIAGIVLLTNSCSENSKEQAVKFNSRKEVSFRCAQSKEVSVAFYDDSVSLELSGGRSFTLARAISASGARYVNSDESIVFWNKGNTAFITENDSITYQKCVVRREADFTNLEAFPSPQDSLTFRYPQSLSVYRKEVADTSGWSYASMAKGQLVVQLKTKKTFQSKTNLSEGTFSVGWSADPQTLKNCMELPEGFISRSDTVSSNGVSYHRTHYDDAGAGNFYEIIQYRTKRDGRCYSLEEMVHSTNIHNYPKEHGISKFDSNKVWNTLQIPAMTFSFTNE